MNEDVCDGCLYFNYLADYCNCLECNINEITDYDTCKYRLEDNYE